MTFDLFPNPVLLYAFVALVAAVAAGGLVLLAGVGGRSLMAHRHDRIARHESIPTYYGHLALSH